MRLIVLAVIAAFLAYFGQVLWQQYQVSLQLEAVSLPQILRLPLPIKHYNPPAVKPADSYTILFLGDSMTAALGENFDSLRQKLKVSYPNKVFGLFNYGMGSTSLATAPKLLTESTSIGTRTEPPILERYYDVIIIESFGYNPLSDLPLTDGLRRQEEILDQLVAQLAYHKHDKLIVFLATIAPSKTDYGRGTVELSDEQRALWANERIAYINNHIKYAKDHNIPLINVFEKSLAANGQADRRFINSDDNIHPSAAGIDLISQTIADYLSTVLPH